MLMIGGMHSKVPVHLQVIITAQQAQQALTAVCLQGIPAESISSQHLTWALLQCRVSC